ncbi:hypothetical protein TRFO_22233 [Tritrichomonas foetus]|uniref:Zinc finger PHD-type domain-containing protein n=1 Tax=Tritrichomonas foetus TaxID=1144522 RepID=A0A1J4KGS0_9EUKA|nr:hypothetical protein TRFO_22233 [Tritrichomonas foetus]|eukprot:OHT08996.1 hypothetical protein TRFO_22233 [Tritrichomonas foetus]
MITGKNIFLIFQLQTKIMTENETAMPMRVIPRIPNNSVIVRCQCRLRAPSGEMIQCSRCGCYSHQKCVKVQIPFICSYCHIASQKLLLERFNKTATKSGIVIDRTKLHVHLINEKTPLEVCELREHTYACGHVGELLRHLVNYVASLDLSLCTLEKHLSNPVYKPIEEELKKAIENNRKLYVRHTSILMEILEKYETAKKNQNVLPDFRDAIIQELL